MKIFKRILLGIILFFIIGTGALYAYKDTLIREIIAQYNEALNITIAYKDVDLSLIKKFPKAQLTVNELSIVNDDMSDTLVQAQKVYFALNIKDLFKKTSKKIAIDAINIENAQLNLLVNNKGLANYDVKRIQNPSLANVEANTNEDKGISIKNYEIKNSTISYTNKPSDIVLNITNINHSGTGNFANSQLDLDTKTTIEAFTFSLDNVTYFNKVKVDLTAVLGIDLDKMKFTFKENKAIINDLALVFDGLIQINDVNQEYDITFNAPKANFKNLLSLVPSAYSNDFSGVSAQGIAHVNGLFKGVLSDNEFPHYTVNIKTNNASFQYPDLPKSVKGITFDGKIANQENDAYLAIKDLKFTIDKDTFETKGKLTKLLSNPTIDAIFKGVLNLENLSKAYPIVLDNELKGVLKADFTLQADQKSISQNNYEKIKTKGIASLTDFAYSDKEMVNPIYIENAAIQFNTNSIKLADFKAKTGKSDLQASGKLDNLFAFVLDDKDLKGDFDISSNTFVVSDFLVTEKVSSNTTNDSVNTATENLKIPNFLNINTRVNAKKVVYDNLVLHNVTGLMKLQNQKATLQNAKATMLDGQVVFNGDIDTKPTPTQFDLNMDIAQFDIAQSFNSLETFQKLVPIAQALKGKYSTKLKLKGSLDNEFMPNLSSLSGNAFAQLLVKNINKSALPLFNQLNSKLDFVDFSKINLDKIKAALSFEKGVVSVKPFDIKYNDITMRVSGSHGFDKSLAYNITMDIPAKYLGSQAENLLSKLTNEVKDTIRIPLKTAISGTLLKPIVKIDSKQALKNLSNKIIAYQKEKLSNQATEEVNNAIGDILSNNGLDSIKNPLDSTKIINPKDIINDGVKEGVKDILDIFGKKKKKTNP
jgi:hypothetical protein